ncbi:uncharacterized protein LOC129569674 [Sitodiplosis mosellana]|uniref:uncharacterized protein LOC129569674 n=1 Tax=Sitodiplosis mosellana TaxID=263140 RepID=UPI0024452120|nr:uncharacterized protein LOC129569674 [Sitodiplosis mosellana]
MVPLAVFGILAIFISTGVECGYSSAGSSSSSNGDGSGHTFTGSSNNGQGTYTHTQNKPGGGSVTQTGGFPGPFYGPANFGQPGFGVNYSPGFPYGPYGNQPAFTPFPQNFGFNSPFQPIQPFQPLPPLQPFAPYQQIATPQEFNQYLNSLQQQYAAYYKQQQELLNTWKNSPFQNGYGGSPNYAYATGAYNPTNGFQQTAGVFPPNKNKPNVDTRFDGSENVAGNAPSGYFGIQTSSFSSSSDVNGVKKHKEVATTTINDNGKVSTHTVEN